MSPAPEGRVERLFVAILLPEAVRSAIAGVVGALRPCAEGIRWASTDAYHLTIRFIGPVEAAGVPAMAGALREGVRDLPAFELALRGAGAFPSATRPRVVWIGVEPSPGLSALREAVESALARRGLERDARGFSPHVTIGRARRAGRAAPALVGAIEAARISVSAPVRSIALVRSHLSPKGSRHETVAACELRGAAAM